MSCLCTDYSTDFCNIWWKGVTHAMGKKTLHFGGNPDHVTLVLLLGYDIGLQLHLGTAILCVGRYALPGTCLIITILPHQWSWQRCVLYCVLF